MLSIAFQAHSLGGLSNVCMFASNVSHEQTYYSYSSVLFYILVSSSIPYFIYLSMSTSIRISAFYTVLYTVFTPGRSLYPIRHPIARGRVRHRALLARGWRRSRSFSAHCRRYVLLHPGTYNRIIQNTNMYKHMQMDLDINKIYSVDRHNMII